MTFRICGALVALGVLTCMVRADNPCINQTSYGPWSCSQDGSVASTGTLTATNFSICAGSTVAPPGLATNPTFNNGQETAAVYQSCYPNMNGSTNAPVTYTAGSLYFVPNNPSWPAITGPFNTPGTYTYQALVNGIPSFNGCDVITDFVATVFVVVSNSPPIIITQPTNQTVFVGNNAAFTVMAMGCPNVNFQWYFNTNNVLTGQTNSTLTLTNVQLTNAGDYSVTVSDLSGSTNSVEAVLTVLTSLGPPPPYITLSGSLTNYVFRRDTTYYIAGPVSLYGTNILEGSAVLKFTNSVNPSANPPVGAGIDVVGTNAVLLCQTGPYRPAILTAMDDNSVGATITNSTGTPTNYYGGVGLYFDVTKSGQPANVQNLRISCLAAGIGFNTGNGHVVSDAQIVHCADAFLTYTNSCSLRNVLVYGVSNVFLNAGGTVDGENLTIDRATNFYSGSLVTANFTNCLVVGVTNRLSYSGIDNYTLASGIGVFESAGAGSCYLSGGGDSPFRNAGTTNINPASLADLEERTTYAPIVMSNGIISAIETLAPQAQRDTGVPALGYHYAPVDFIADNVTVANGVVLTVTNGAVIACYNGPGLILSGGSSVISTGTPLAPNWFVRYSSVQEQPISLGGAPSAAIMLLPQMPGIGIRGSFQFSDFTCPADGGYHLYSSNNWSYSSLTVQECEFWTFN